MNLYSICLLLICISVATGFPTIERKDGQGTPGRCYVENFACETSNILNKFEDTQTNEGCRQRCRENDECAW